MAILLVLLLVIPAVAAIVVALLGPRRRPVIRWISLGAVLLDLALAVVLAVALVQEREAAAASKSSIFHPQADGTFHPLFVPGAEPGKSQRGRPVTTTWTLLDLGQGSSINFYLGLDGLNVWLVVLTALLMVPSVLISWDAIKDRVHEYYAWLLLLGTAMLGVFLAFDIILFYVFFELTLVPLFFLIGIWGGPDRRPAARKFFIYTLAGSVITLLGLLAIVVFCYTNPPPGTSRVLTFAIPELVRRVQEVPVSASWINFQFWVFLALVAGFAIKVPLVPVHTWLPLAHVEAPTAGSVLLAGVLLKIGSYGFLRLCLPLTPDACLTYGLPLIGTLAVIGIIYGALCALAQNNIKKLVAYSSVSHMGFCMLGMFAFNAAGLTGSLLQMINHGLSTAGLFLLVGMLYERYHTLKSVDYSGLGARLRLFSVCMVFIVLTSVGLPGLNGFVGEALVFFGIFPVHRPLAILGTAGIVLGALYLLTMLLNVFFGPLKEPAHEGGPVPDLKPREALAIVPIMALCLVLGVYPQPAIAAAQPDLHVVVRILQTRATGLQLMEKQEVRTAISSGNSPAAIGNPQAGSVEGE